VSVDLGNRSRSLRVLPGPARREQRGTIVRDRALAPSLGTPQPVRLLIAESQALVRAGYRSLLERHPRIEVVAEAGSCEQAIVLASRTRPDVAMLDLGLPDVRDVDDIASIVHDPAFADAAVMLVVPRELDERVVTGVRAGALGVLKKDAHPDDLIQAVEVLARGDGVFPAGTVRRLVAERSGPPLQDGTHDVRLDSLTDREREVVALVARGLSNREIGQRLVISVATAKTHVSRAMVKLGARHRAQLVVLAYETGMVQPHDTAQGATGRLLASA
jgi:DNA-binding NarL/FixJ family response regulator